MIELSSEQFAKHVRRMRAEFQLFCVLACESVFSTIVNDDKVNYYDMPDTLTAQARTREYRHFWEAL